MRVSGYLKFYRRRLSHPLQRTFLPDPDIANDQDAEEDQHLEQAEQAEGLELHRPRKKEDGLHIEDHKQDGDNVIADGVASTRTVDRIDAAFVGQQLLSMGIVGPNQSRQQKGDRDEDSDDRYKNKNRYVVLRQSLPRLRYCSRPEKREGE